MSKNLKQIQKTIGEYDREQFNILDMDTWNFASSKRGMIWNGKELRNEETGRVNTEKDVVGLARAMFEVLEESCETIAAEKKIEAIKNLLDNIADLEQAKRRRIEKEEEIDSGILDGLFDPRDPETFQYAKRLKPLVIDGVQIYDVYIDEEGMEAKENVTEKRFADGLSLTFKMNSTMPEMTAEEKRERAEKHVRQKVAECTPAVQRNLSVFGGYSFSEAQMEIMDGLSPEKKTKIGEIMSTEKSGRKREQQIRNSLGVDGFWVVKLDDLHDFPDLEEERMQEYFMTYEFDEEDEIHEVFNASPYLKNRPRMKAELTERAIEFLRDEE
ncbi:MAG: hypothetical protein FWE09_00025 [Treponema sp.]|nr:hypothetical protein [Treponema sp.]